LQYGELVNNIHTTNPTLLIAQKNIILSNLSLKERLAERWPTLSFNSAYNFTQQDNKAVVNPFTPLYSQNKGFNYGLSATIPILNGFNTRRLIRQAKLDVQYQELFFNNQRTLIDVNVSNAFKDYEYQKRALLLEEENILLARENTMIALERFRQGVSTYLELRETQISLADAYNRLITARYDTKLAETQLLQLKGDLVR
jgi:outer membrane protein TolC